jgi:nitroreductase
VGDDTFEEVAALMRAQSAGRRLKSDPIDDDTVLDLLELARYATADRRRRTEFVVVRDPDVRHQLARTYRQGWSIYKRVLRERSTRL